MYVDICKKSSGINFNHNNKEIEIIDDLISYDLRDTFKKLCRLKKETVVLGDVYDPYFDSDKTKEVLKVIEENHLGLLLYVKNDLFLSDIEILNSINKESNLTVIIDIPTLNDINSFFKSIDFNKLINIFKVLDDNNITYGIRITPILPFINDDINNFKDIIDGISKYNVKYLLYYNEGIIINNKNKDKIYKYIDSFYPGLYKKYDTIRNDSYVIKSGKESKRFINELCDSYYIMTDNDKIMEKILKYEKKIVQLSLFE